MLEELRKKKEIRSSLEADVELVFLDKKFTFLSEAEWSEVLIVSTVTVCINPLVGLEELDTYPSKASGAKCARCWKVLPEVGSDARHPTLCLRCADAVESGLVCRAAAA